jgi:hypothetical protein
VVPTGYDTKRKTLERLFMFAKVVRRSGGLKGVGFDESSRFFAFLAAIFAAARNCKIVQACCKNKARNNNFVVIYYKIEENNFKIVKNNFKIVKIYFKNEAKYFKFEVIYCNIEEKNFKIEVIYYKIEENYFKNVANDFNFEVIYFKIVKISFKIVKTYFDDKGNNNTFEAICNKPEIKAAKSFKLTSKMKLKTANMFHFDSFLLFF